ncbi:hypothetical protein H6F89_28440 [Cyanobacteria bacterium FACHB-63]|nr:hypothetical protein [Cyanobacteria bacterium FACHB-63]
MTTNRTIHPSELAQLLQNRFVARSAAVGLLLVSLCLLAGASRSKSPEARLWLFGGSFVSAALCRVVHKIAIDNERLFEDSRDISLTNWQNQLFKRTRDEGLTLEAQVQPETEKPELLPLFDWQELSNADEHPILGIVSPMGGGKSRLARYLARYILFPGQNPEISVFDIYARSNDWQGCSIITEHDDMTETMSADLDVIAARLQEYRSGKDDFVGMFRVIEEGADTFKTLQAMSKDAQKTVDTWVSKFTTVTRKIKARMCIVSVKLSGADFGTGAESRNDATIIFPGLKGISKAMTDDRIFKLGAKQNKELREQLKASLAGVKRPALVYSQGCWFPASVPDLDANGNPIGGTPIDFSPSIERLNRLYEVSIDDKEIVEASHQLSTVQEAILELSDKKGWLRARDCQQTGWSQFSGKSADDIRGEFLTLSELQLGICRHSGERLQFCSDGWDSDSED